MMEEVTLKVVANVLSMLTIASCLLLKVPQIYSVRERRSADGLYVQAMIMEITGFTIMTLYCFTNSYGYMTYLEYPIILLQVYVLFYYVLTFKRLMHLPVVPISILIYVAIVLAFVTEILPKEILAYLVPACTPLSGFAKVMYIYGIVKNKNADAISLTTWVISILTNLARIFTVYMDSADGTLMFNFLFSAALSSGVLGTAIYYQRFVPPPRPPGRPRRKPSYRRNSVTFDKYD